MEARQAGFGRSTGMKCQGDGQRHREAGQVVTRMDEGVGQDTDYTGSSEVSWCPAKCPVRW